MSESKVDIANGPVGGKSLVDRLVERHGVTRSALIPILQDVQDKEGYLSRRIVVELARALNLPASKIYGVATFYNQFRFQAPGKYQIQVCRGTACHVKGSATVLNALERELDIHPGETTRDGLFSLEVVACIGACGLAPVICINGEYHAQVEPDQIGTILRQYREQEKTEA
jgi:NADH-quinone oxidoreductase subunit E